MATNMMRALTPHAVAPRAGSGRCSELRWDRAKRAIARGLLTIAAALAVSHSARAELPELSQPTQQVGPHGLAGGRYVGSALTGARSLRLSSSLGYGYTGDVLNDGDRHQRLAGELFGAAVVHPALQISLGSELRFDGHHTRSEGNDRGLLANTRLTTRHALQLQRFAIAAQPALIFPGASSAKRSFQAVGVELQALGSYALSPRVQLGMSLGYRFDGSERALADPFGLSRSDRLAASISSHDAVLVGGLLSYALSPFSALVEWSWDIASGGPQSPSRSPMRVRVAAQRQFADRFLPGVELGLDTSSRPSFDALVRIEPRLWLRLGLTVLLDRQPPPRPPVPAPPPEAPAAVKVSPLTLAVVDDAGQAIAGARVVLTQGERTEEHRCDDTGQVTLQLPRGVTAVSVEAEGYEPHWQTVTAGSSEPQRITLGRSLPAAELKGAVRSLSGGAPLRARVEVVELGQVVETQPDGQFVLGVAPGRYTLRIGADGYETQERVVQVELRGVTILVIDLRGAPR